MGKGMMKLTLEGQVKLTNSNTQGFPPAYLFWKLMAQTQKNQNCLLKQKRTALPLPK